jgi:hypothetical protein
MAQAPRFLSGEDLNSVGLKVSVLMSTDLNSEAITVGAWTFVPTTFALMHLNGY